MDYKVKNLEVRKKYQDYLLWLFNKINGFPQKQKFILGVRIGNQALDISELLIRIQYASQEKKPDLLVDFNLKLEIMRSLMRIAWSMKFLSHESFSFQEAKIDEVGRMAWGLVNVGVKKNQ